MSLSDAPVTKKAKRNRGWFHEIISTFVYPLVAVVAVYTLLFQPFRIPSGSMIDTLLIGDFVWVEKFSYGYSKHSIPFSPDVFEGRIWAANPQQGEVAVFKWPVDDSTDFIKRVIGLPGDKVQMKEGRLYINGVAAKTDFVEDVDFEYYDPQRPGPSGNGLVRYKGKKYLETLPNGVSHYILKESDSGRENNTPEFTVPDGQYFMMGDNRDNSQDSRSWGGVPVVNFVGRAVRIFPSVDGAKSAWYEVWNWPFAIRWDRLFQSID
ncbi:Signal peptidase I [Alphaproteobacteria bacterium SO-S41]|nr:Signal peptidase I [Alphaproteobacteria bacterium SO-S41]